MRKRVIEALAILVVVGSVGAYIWQRSTPHNEAPVVTETSPRQRPSANVNMAAHAPSVLAALKPMPRVPLTPEQLASHFAGFKAEGYDSSNFNVLALPFRYEDPDGVGDASEANALAFLLSDDLDWAPGNFNARHAYFVFARSGPEMAGLAAKYDSAVIARQVDDWHATHAVGGVLRRSRAGCSGTLELFGTDGRPAFTRTYAEPRPYFDLLGDMAVDLIGHFGPSPTVALVDHLHRARCQHPESLVRLGLAAFHPLRGPEAFGQYEHILRDDPSFAEVRWWWANQSWWENPQGIDRDAQAALAMHDRLTVGALEFFSPSSARDSALLAEYPKWVDQAEQLVGPDAPLVVRQRLTLSAWKGQFDPALRRRAIAAASRHPNNNALLRRVAGSLLDSPVDATMAASICLASIRSRYLDAVGDYDDEWGLFTTAADHLGRPDLAIARPALRASSRSGPLVGSIRALCNAGRFDDAASQFDAIHAVRDDVQASEAAHWAAFAAAVAGNDRVAGRLRWAHARDFDTSGMGGLLALRDRVRRTPDQTIDVAELGRLAPRFTGDGPIRPTLALAADIDLSLDAPTLGDRVRAHLKAEPGLRLWWVLADAYERRRATPGAARFYDAIGWLHPEDPWVTRATADAATRGQATPPAGQDPAVERTLASLRPFPAEEELGPSTRANKTRATLALTFELDPWTLASLVHGRLAAGDKAAARDLALRFRRLAADAENVEVGAFASDLVDRTTIAPRG